MVDSGPVENLFPGLQRQDTKTSSGCIVRSWSYHHHSGGPVLCLVHGFPQSPYQFRHLVPLLKDRISLFMPGLPGYGLSSLYPAPDKRTVGNILIEALQAVFSKDTPVIWCSHDRGARVGHRLLVDNNPAHNIRSAVLMDIVPTLAQWNSFANPIASVAYYHWPFLATPTAPQLIEQMGGHAFCSMLLTRGQGANAEGVAKSRENLALEHYSHLFGLPETIAGSCADYKSAAEGEVVEQEEDQKAGRKITKPTLAIYSASNLGRMHDVPKVWKEWVSEGTVLRVEGIPDGYGHYLPEECPERIAKLILQWIDGDGKA